MKTQFNRNYIKGFSSWWEDLIQECFPTISVVENDVLSFRVIKY